MVDDLVLCNACGKVPPDGVYYGCDYTDEEEEGEVNLCGNCASQLQYHAELHAEDCPVCNDTDECTAWDRLYQQDMADYFEFKKTWKIQPLVAKEKKL
jgi:hypothetical protein